MKNVISDSRLEAIQQDCGFISNDHFLLAIINGNYDGRISRLFKINELLKLVKVDDLKKELEAFNLNIVKRNIKLKLTSGQGNLPLLKESEKALQTSREIATSFDDKVVNIKHVILAILSSRDDKYSKYFDFDFVDKYLSAPWEDVIRDAITSKDEYINISGVGLTDFPIELTSLPSLKKLDLSFNQLQNIPSEILKFPSLIDLNLDENPISNVPIEIVSQGFSALRDYFNKLREGGTYFYEAKLLIIGEGGVGKTTLARKLMNSNSPMPKEEDTTKGIEINYLDFKSSKGDDFRIHIWDFGGQEIYHSTHQFFLTKRSLYILVDDTRKDEMSFDYWLQISELLSDNSPLLIIQNEKADRSKNLNIKGLKSKYENLRELFKSNLLTNRGLDEIKSAIKYYIQRLPHVGDVLPNQWLVIRNRLETIGLEKNHISLEEYLDACNLCGLSEMESAMHLSSYLHDLGIFLHFKDDYRLCDLFILNNTWATEAVYKVLDSEEVKDNYGKFNYLDLQRIWSEEKYKKKHIQLIALMERFELCYKLPDSSIDRWEWLAPQLLSFEKPIYDWDNEVNLNIKYKYDFLPKGLLSRFIVRLNRYIKQELVWKNGVVLDRDNTTCEVVEWYGSNQIEIKISGSYKKEFATIIVDTIENLNSEYPTLKVGKLVPCICEECAKSSDPHFYNYHDLKVRLEKGKTTIECGYSYENIDVNLLLEGVYIREEVSSLSFINLNIKEEIFNLIQKGMTLDALNKASIICRNTPLAKETILIFARYSEVMKSFNNGLIDYKEMKIEINSVNNALLEIFQ